LACACDLDLDVAFYRYQVTAVEWSVAVLTRVVGNDDLKKNKKREFELHFKGETQPMCVRALTDASYREWMARTSAILQRLEDDPDGDNEHVDLDDFFGDDD
jgi:hypothetical protein